MTASTGAFANNMALQKYMLLQEQHDTLCLHLDQIRPSSQVSPAFSSPFSTPSTSPTRTSREPSISPRRHSRSSERKHTRGHARCSGWDDARRGSEATLDTITDEETIYEVLAEEQKLFDVNEGIKRALMELLNCEAARGDYEMRKWVQMRLMEKEKELRSGRRRRAS